jgi:hypothetical protein
MCSIAPSRSEVSAAPSRSGSRLGQRRPWPGRSGSATALARRPALVSVLLILALLLGGCRRDGPPPELAAVQAEADALLRANRLRTTPLRFTLEVGETAGYWAQQLGLCPRAPQGEDPDTACAAWAHGAPGDAASPLQRQLQRLAYLYGNASARTYPQGLVSFDRSFFLVQGHDRAALRCVVAHELVHFLRRHAYLSSRRLQQPDLRDRPAPERDRVLAALSQQQELAADRGALLMTAISGQDPASCVRQLQEAAELEGDYAAEDPLASHPGHGRRIAAARAYLARGLADDLAAWRSQGARSAAVTPRWRWDPQDRLLTVTTRP